MRSAIILFLTLGISFSPAGVTFADEKKTEPAAAETEKAGKPVPPEVGAEQPVAQPVGQSAPQAIEESAANKEPETIPAVEPGNVTVNFKGADIKTVLAYIAEVSGVDIVPSPDVKGVVDLKLTNKPWKVALDIIVRNYGFAYEREGDIVRVVTVDKLKQEELVSQVFPLNYSKAKDVVDSLKGIVSERGKAMYDDRTNTVLVTDIPTNIYKIGQIIERLDKKTQQVLIEARVIETVLDDSEKLGIDWNVKITASGAKRPITFPFDYYKPGNQYLDKFEPLVQTGQEIKTFDAQGNVVTTKPGLYPAGASGVSNTSKGFPFVDFSQAIFTNTFQFGTLDFTQFQAVLEMIKARANTDIVSNPRIATLNNTEALINIGHTLNMPVYERSSSTGKMEITGYQAKDLGVILKVTPHVNDKGEIVIDLSPEISDLLRYDTLDAASGVVAPVFSMRIAKTKIMVKDGDTIFIGGLIKENNIDRRTKLPIIGDILGDVPYLGLLFSKKETVKQKTELIFFITVNLMTVDKIIKDAPLPNKVYVPMYSLSQGDSKSSRKKQLNRK